MKSVPIKSLPANTALACERLSEQLQRTLDGDLVALWAYGAATFPDRPKQLGDVDTHAVLARQPAREVGEVIDNIHRTIADDLGVEWDSWYILQSDARKSGCPVHVFRTQLVDSAWALHRAHWLAGQFVALYGSTPAELVHPPTEYEIMDALRSELGFIERLIGRGLHDPGHAAFAVRNSCRIMYSLETGDVVVSKSAASRWAFQCMPPSWQEPIRAAGRIYNGEATPNDRLVVQASIVPIVLAVRDRIERVE